MSTDLRTSEDYLIGCCLLDEGVTLDRLIQAGLEPRHFGTRGRIYADLRRLRGEGVPIALDTLIPRMNGQADVLLQLSSPEIAPTTARVGHHLSELLHHGRLQDEINATRAKLEALERGEFEPAPRDQTKAIQLLQSRRVRASAKPPEPVTRLFLADKPICTPGNITTLTSKAKTGKTATLGAATAAIISASAGTGLLHDTFKFRAANPAGHAVLVFDTEQSPYDAYLCYERSLKRAGTDTDPAWLHHYSLVGYTAAQLHEALELALQQAKAEHGGIFCIILDGCADFVNSVNDEAECNQFVTWLRTKTVDFETAAICVIHSNEGDKAGDDSRGHLGKQLIRKAESNLLLKKEGEVTTITSDKQRKAPITEADQVAFKWSDQENRHVSCEGESKKKAGGRTKLHSIREFWECLPKPGQPPMTGTQLHRFAIQIREIKPNTFKDLLADAAQDGLLTRTYDPKTGYAYVIAGPAPKLSEPTELPPWDGPPDGA